MSNKLFQQLKKKMGSSMTTADGAEAVVTHFIDTGCDLLNANISNKPNGGWPCRRITEIFGQESIGKTTLIYEGMKNCQAAGGIVIYCDVEQAISPDMMQNIGVNMEEVLYCNEIELETIYAFLEKTLGDIIALQPKNPEEQFPVLILLDSLAQMTTKQELEMGYELNMNTALQKAKLLGQSYRKINGMISAANAAFIIINQLRDAPGQMGNPTTTPGGKATKFAASVRVELKGKKNIEQFDPEDEKRYLEAKAKHKAKGGGALGAPKKPASTIQIGCSVTAKVVKNKIGPPLRECSFDIIFMEGIDNATGLFMWGVEVAHIIDKINNQNYGFAFDAPDYKQFGKFKKATFNEVLENPEAYAAFMKEASPRLYRKPIEYDVEAAEEAEEVKASLAFDLKERDDDDEEEDEDDE